MKKISLHALLTSLLLLMTFSVNADETEIFYQNDAASTNANVLFLLDGSGSMRTEVSGSGSSSRMQVMKEAFREVIADAPDNINIGLMDYANTPTGVGYGWSSIKGITFPVSPAGQDAADVIGGFSAVDNLSVSTTSEGEELPVKEFLANVVDTWGPSGYTPIVDSLYEAARYFQGEEAFWGKFPPSYKWAAHPSSYTGDVQCNGAQQETCIKEWGECNGSEQSCSDYTLGNVCCNWLENSDGTTYCENDNYSCSETLTSCEHSVCDSVSGSAVYNSPIEYECQSNYLVLMSDGKPEYTYYPAYTDDGTGRYAKSARPDQAHDYSIMPNLLPNISSSDITNAIPGMIGGSCVDSPNGYASGTCGPELTAFLAGNDLMTGLEGNQTVETYTVAFGMGGEPEGKAYLESLATAEDGAFTAENSSELVEAFKSVFGQIKKNSFSFSSPSFSVSEDSLLSHGANVYIPVLDSNKTPLWSGNLRKFSLTEGGSIIGSNSQSALTDSGDFSEDAQDLWSTEPHGTDVKAGGAASKIPDPALRMLRTDSTSKALVEIDTTASITLLPNDLFADTYQTWHDLKPMKDNPEYADKGHYTDCNGDHVHVKANPTTNKHKHIDPPVHIKEVTTCSTTNVTTEQRNTLINFVRGYVDGVTGDDAVVRKHMGDMLNTKPVVVSYQTSATTTQTLVLAATNEGYLHAMDADTGIEQWAFMPSSLLKNQKIFMDDDEEKRHVYGLDGPLTLWSFTDTDNAGNEVEKKYLFFGMRRGGNMYYALDVSTPDVPTVVWKISPEGEDGAISTGYASLGETWSKPTLSRMRNPADPSEILPVLVFGGGYDPIKEEQDRSVRGNDTELGSDVYIVNAQDGSLLWSLKDSNVSGADALEHSIPGDIRVLDMDNDGTLDRMYFADTGGYVWRVDMATSVDTSGGSVSLSLDSTLTQFADLGEVDADEGDATDGDRRKFFYEPDTALRLSNGVPTLTVSIGSGYRTHPLDTGDYDRFYVLLDENIYQTPPLDFDAITESDLMSVTELRESTEKNILKVVDKKGWYYPLGHHGEKVLATSLTFLDKVIFTTFAMADKHGNDSVVSACEPAVNTARAYILDLLTAQPVANLDREITIETEGEGEDESTTIITTKEDFLVAGFNEILDSPQLIFSELASADGGDCTHDSCQQSVSVRIGKLDLPVLDTDNSNEDSYSESVDLTKILPRLYWRDDDVTSNQELEGVDSSVPE